MCKSLEIKEERGFFLKGGNLQGNNNNIML
jgi:hypothetical protein